MAVRVVNGNTFTEDGWPLVDEAGCTWVAIPGTNDGVHLEIQSGQPMLIMRAYAAAHHQFVEPVLEADSACWTPTNDVLGQPGQNNGSNHLGGTAMDLRWKIHTFQVSYAGYSQAQIDTVREILDFFEGMIWWGEDWGLQNIGPFDCMHFQMGYNTYGSENVGRVQDFINRKIRVDGFSTFRQGSAPPPPPVLSRADRYGLAIITEGQRLGITPRGNKIALSVGLVESELTNYANSNDPASIAKNPDGSDVYPHDAVGSDHMSVGWAQQQPNWGSLSCRMDITCAATLFFTCDNGPGTRGLTKIRDRSSGADGPLYDYNDESHTPGFYAQKVQGSEFPDRYDQRYADAEAMYNRLLVIAQPPPVEGFLMALSDSEQQEVLNYVRAEAVPRKSSSPLRHWGEGTIGNTSDTDWATNGLVHVLAVYLLARLGDPEQLALLHEVANGDPSTDPGRQHDSEMAQQILADIGSPPPPPSNTVSGPTGTLVTGTMPPALASTTALAVVVPESQKVYDGSEDYGNTGVVSLHPTTTGADDVLNALESLGKFDVKYRSLFDKLTKGNTP